MKKYLTAVALLTLFATPVLAQAWDPDVGSGNIAPAPYGENLDGSSIYQKAGPGYNAFGEAPRAKAAHKTRATKHNVSDVVTDLAGNKEQDPDLNIRSQLERESEEF